MRVVSLLPAATEWIRAFDGEHLLVGCTHACRQPGALPVLTRSLVDGSDSAGGIDSRVQEVLATGKSLFIVDEDRLRALEPDVVIVQDLCAVCSVSGDALGSRLANFARPPAVVAFSPASLKQVLTEALALARHLRILPAAMRYIAAREKELAHLRANIGIERDGSLRHVARPRTLLLEWVDPPMTAGHWIPDMVEKVGGEPLRGAAGGQSTRITWEAVDRANPDIVIVAACGRTVPETQADMIEQPGWRATRSWQTKRAWIIDARTYVTMPGPSIYRAMALLASVIHPQCVPSIADAWELQPVASAAGYKEA